MKARSRQPHQPPERPPLRLAAGDEVSVGDRSADWPAFVFVTARNGEGWVPERHIAQVAGVSEMTTAYDTTELEVESGDEVEVIEQDDPSGWWWCRSADGREGWIPVAVLEPLGR